MSASATETAAAEIATSPATTKRARSTFMLHKPDTMECLSKFQSSDYRYGALKAASRGHTVIWLRKTNSKEIRVYSGEICQLDEPAQIKRGDRTITYSKKPVVKFVRKFVWTGEINEDEEPDLPAAPPAPKRAKKAAAASAGDDPPLPAVPPKKA